MTNHKKYYADRFACYPDVVDVISFREMMGGILMHGALSTKGELSISLLSLTTGYSNSLSLTIC